MHMIKKELKVIILEALEEYFAAQSTPVTKNEFIDVVQAATLLNLAAATVYEKTSRKQLPHYKKGKKIMFKRSELVEWMESGKVSGEDETERRVNEYLQSRDLKNKR